MSTVETLAPIPVLICWMPAGLVFVVTVLPMSNTNIWWIRVMDFPHLQIAIIGGAIMLGALIVPGLARLVVPLMMAAACGYQLWRIYP